MEEEAQRIFHKPVLREIVMTFDKPWEGQGWYHTIFQDGDLYRMYLKARKYENLDRNEGSGLTRRRTEIHRHTIYFESRDSIHWTRPNLGLVEYEGSKKNNILLSLDGHGDFQPFRDENPDVAHEALYKATTRPGKYLIPWQSPDGIHWKITQDEAIIKDGAFDSQNIAFWDPNINAYRAYYQQPVAFADTRSYQLTLHKYRFTMNPEQLYPRLRFIKLYRVL